MTIEELEALATAAEAEATKVALTDDEQKREVLRVRIEKANDDKLASLKARAFGTLAEREESARSALGRNCPIVGLLDMSSTGTAHTFVLRYAGSAAFTKWQRNAGFALLNHKDPTTKKAINAAENDKAFAFALVYDWNGVVVDPKGESGAQLAKTFDEFSGIVSAICLAGRELSGAAMEARKSAG